MEKCSQCNQEKNSGHTCPSDSSGDFVTSMIVGAITDNAALGAIVGGDIAGAILGDIMNDGQLF